MQQFGNVTPGCSGNLQALQLSSHHLGSMPACQHARTVWMIQQIAMQQLLVTTAYWHAPLGCGAPAAAAQHSLPLSPDHLQLCACLGCSAQPTCDSVLPPSSSRQSHTGLSDIAEPPEGRAWHFSQMPSVVCKSVRHRVHAFSRLAAPAAAADMPRVQVPGAAAAAGGVQEPGSPGRCSAHGLTHSPAAGAPGTSL